MTRLKILVVSPDLPFPPTWGSGMRTYQLARALARTNDVTLLGYECDWHPEAAAEWGSFCQEIISVARPATTGLAKRARQGRSLLSPLPHHARGLKSPAMQAAIDDCLQGDFDVVQVESSLLMVHDFGSTVPLVLDEHNIESEILQRMRLSEQSRLRRLFNYAEGQKQQRLETRTWANATACAVTSERDRTAVLEKLPDARVEVVPNGVDPDHFAPQDRDVDPDSLVFTGLLSYRPNLDGVRHFIAECLPRIRRIRPSATLTVVGAGTLQERQSLEGEGVLVTGWVPDLRPYLARAAAVVVPVRMGGGTRLKVVEALSMGKGVVATTLGCEGLDVESGRHLIVADSPDDFAESSLQLLADDALRGRLGEAGRELVIRRYSWQEAGQRLAELHSEVFEHSRLVRSASAVTT